MELPTRTDLPFFAYGVFKPGQLGYHRLAQFVNHAEESEVRGNLRIRDGLPILDTSIESDERVAGYVLHFREEGALEAYSQIAGLEPDTQYVWCETTIVDYRVNVLAGRSPQKGSVPAEGEWDGSKDPLFTSAPDVVHETLLANREFAWDLKPLFTLQSAYLLLWSSIERYLSLRYHPGDRVMEKVNHLADEPAFAESLRRVNPPRRHVHRSDRPAEKVVLDADNPKKSVAYYYQIRSNITHRGKAVVVDHERLASSLEELLTIYRDVLRSAFTLSSRDG